MEALKVANGKLLNDKTKLGGVWIVYDPRWTPSFCRKSPAPLVTGLPLFAGCRAIPTNETNLFTFVFLALASH
jgi:hypothetical protein